MDAYVRRSTRSIIRHVGDDVCRMDNTRSLVRRTFIGEYQIPRCCFQTSCGECLIETQNNDEENVRSWLLMCNANVATTRVAIDVWNRFAIYQFFDEWWSDYLVGLPLVRSFVGQSEGDDLTGGCLLARNLSIFFKRQSWCLHPQNSLFGIPVYQYWLFVTESHHWTAHVVGQVNEQCVESTVRYAAVIGYFVTLGDDACSSTTTE